MHGPSGVLVVLPALNEAESVGVVVKEVKAAVPDADVLVVDDGSSDATAAAAREAGSQVISNVFTLGVGGAMRVGFRFAQARGYRVLVQVDADGQHDPRDIPRLLAALGDHGRPDDDRPLTIIGARFAGEGTVSVPVLRRWAMWLLATYLSRRTGTRLSDVTSGFRAHNRASIELFARHYPAEYLADTVESLIIASRAGGRVAQVPVAMRPRHSGEPSQSALRATAYLLRIVLMLLLSIVKRPDHRRKTGPL